MYVVRLIEPTGERKYFMRTLSGEHAGAHLTTWAGRQVEATRLSREQARQVVASLLPDGFPVRVVRLRERVGR